MAGINLTGPQRSQLLERLLAQQGQQRPQIRSGVELAARLGEQLIRQQQIKKEQEVEAGVAKTTRANEVAVLNKLLGGGDTDFQGRPVTGPTPRGVNELGFETATGQPQQKNNIDLIQALGQLQSDNPTGAAITDQLVKNAFAAEKPRRTGVEETKKGGVFVKELIELDTGEVIRELGRGPRRTEQVVGAPGDFETPGNRDDETKRKRAVLNLTGELAESLRNVQENPRSTGMVGAAASAANAFGDIPILGTFITTVTEEATNLNPSELAEVRTQAESMVAKLVPVITGDISGRYTDKEQERTRDIQAQSKFWKTSAQVTGGLGELQAIQVRSEIKTTGQEGLNLLAGRPINLASDDGLEQWGEILMQQYGLPFEKAVDEIEKHMQLLEQ